MKRQLEVLPEDFLREDLLVSGAIDKPKTVGGSIFKLDDLSGPFADDID